jgi:hypothetical protein
VNSNITNSDPPTKVAIAFDLRKLKIKSLASYCTFSIFLVNS